MKDYHPEWLKIAEKLDQLDAQKKQAMVSPDVYAEIQRLKINLFGLVVRSSPLFPYETLWDACDVETREPIKIASGEWVHGFIMPKLDADPPIQPNFWFEESTIEGHKWMCWLDKPIIFKGRMF